MARPIPMQVRGQWKDVEIDPNAFLDKEFAGFGCLKEMTDYEFLGLDGKLLAGSKKTKKQKQKVIKNKPDKGSTPQTCSVQDDGESKKVTKKKKKRKKKKKGSGNSEINTEKVPDEVCQTATHISTETAPEKNVGGTKAAKKKKQKKKKTSEQKNEVSCIETEHSPEMCTKGKAVKRKSKGNNDAIPPKKNKLDKTEHVGDIDEVASKEDSRDMSAWQDLYVPDVVLKALAEKGFTAPTPIQALALAPAIRDRRDILGAAETGSGKTLAFGIPVIHQILQLKARQMEEDDAVLSDDELIPSEDEDHMVSEEDEEEGQDVPAPDDEEEMSDASLSDEEYDNDEDLEDTSSGIRESEMIIGTPKKPLYCLVLTPTRELAMQVREHLQTAAKYAGILVVAVVGGMSCQKQARLLRRCPEIVVATPGRLWELIKQGDPHLNKVKDVHSLVIDEADRMVEKGHFEELTELLQLINSTEKQKKKKRQTYVFSATLTMLHTLPGRLKWKKKPPTKMDEKQKLEMLIAGLGVEEKPMVIDLTRSAGTAETLTEARINCTIDEKDMYLYYFLNRYPGRTLVFTNSKSCIYRLVSVFRLLQCCPLPLHADMQQKQRLKNLDRFKGNPKGLLLATDVAARGLDIPDVQHVIHYQVSRTTENYVHRSGRTARASKEGLSIMLVGPEDLHSYRKIIQSLNKDEDLPLFPVEQDFLKRITPHVHMAHDIDKEAHRVNKQSFENSWYKKAAKEMDMELDDNMLDRNVDDEYEQSQVKNELRRQKKQLQALLAMPLLQRSYSGKYPTQSGKLPVSFHEDDIGPVRLVKEQHKKDKNTYSQHILQQPKSRKHKRVKKSKNKKGKQSN